MGRGALVKPLSETHQTLMNCLGKYTDADDYWIHYVEPISEELQSCCVDVVEHECDVKEAYRVGRLQGISVGEAEVVRLKKEYDKLELALAASVHSEKGFDAGVLVGERRAMERVKNVIEERVKHFERLVILPRIEHKEEMKGRLKEIKALKNVLGLDSNEEVRS